MSKIYSEMRIHVDDAVSKDLNRCLNVKIIENIVQLCIEDLDSDECAVNTSSVNLNMNEAILLGNHLLALTKIKNDF